MYPYKNIDDLDGLEKVLYRCPICGKESIKLSNDHHSLICKECGFKETSDKYGFLHVEDSNKYKEYRYVYDWDLKVYEMLKEEISKNIEEYSLSSNVEVKLINDKKHKYENRGVGTLKLYKNHIFFKGTIDNEEVNYDVDIITSFLGEHTLIILNYLLITKLIDLYY